MNNKVEKQKILYKIIRNKLIKINGIKEWLFKAILFLFSLFLNKDNIIVLCLDL